MSSPSEDSKYEVERHRMCRESEALTDECLSVPHILNRKMEKRSESVLTGLQKKLSFVMFTHNMRMKFVKLCG